MAAVVLSTTAAHDLSRIRGWLSQSGAGERSKRTAERIANAIRRLSTSYGMHPIDRFDPASRQLVIDSYVLTYRLRFRDEGQPVVFVERIYGPGQDR